MRTLLERAGFRIRNSKRADCAHCPPTKRDGSVSYTDTVAFCHRCGWKSSRAQLERELNPRIAPRIPPSPLRQSSARQAVASLPHSVTPRAGKSAAKREAEALLAAFRAWFEWTLLLIGKRERELFWAKRKLTRLRRERPDDDSLWDEIIRITEEENHLEELWEFVTRDPLPRWLEKPATLQEVFEFWRTRCHKPGAKGVA